MDIAFDKIQQQLMIKILIKGNKRKFLQYQKAIFHLLQLTSNSMVKT